MRAAHAAALPPALLAASHWLLWKDQPPTKAGGKRRKVPYYANGVIRHGRLNSPEDLARLTSHADASAALAEGGGYAGLGFALGEGWQGCDLDGVRDPVTGRIVDWAQAIIDKAATYAEVSPSGRGVHLLGYDLDRPALRALAPNASGVEFYSSGRFFTFTGQVLKGQHVLRALTPVYGLAEKRWLTAAEVTKRASSSPPAKPGGSIEPEAPALTWPGDALALAAGLMHVPCPAGDYQRWRDVGMGIHDACGGSEEGFAIWHAWSKERPGYEGEADCRKYWKSFKKKSGGITIRTVQALMNEHAPKAEPLPGSGDPPKLPMRFMVGDLKRMNIPAVEWVIEGLVAPGLSLLAAPPKEGKSYLALQWCLCVAAGVPTHGVNTRQMPVSYFDLEEWHQLLEERVDSITKGHGLPAELPCRIILETGVGDKALEDIAAEIEAGSKLIVVDILAKVRDEMNEDAKKNAYARDVAVIGRIAAFALSYYHRGVAIVVVHHANKGQHDDWKKKISGSTGITGAVHTVMYLERADMRSKDEEDKRDALNYRVLHAVGKLVRDQEITLEKMPDMGGWQSSMVKPWEIAATAKRRRVLKMLAANKGAWVKAKDVADALGMRLANCRQLLYQMALAGMIDSDGQGGLGYRLRL